MSLRVSASVVRWLGHFRPTFDRLIGGLRRIQAD